MSEQTTDPGRDAAWGDVMMPEAALPGGSTPGTPPPADQDANRPAPVDVWAAARADTDAYAFGATTSTPSWGAVYARPPLGPGNEAMEGGASAAPRGYTGGAMGKFIAGLSPSFAEAARGDPAPGGDALYTAGEAATTFGPGSGIAHPTAPHSPERAPSQRPNTLDEPTDSGTE